MLPKKRSFSITAAFEGRLRIETSEVLQKDAKTLTVSEIRNAWGMRVGTYDFLAIEELLGEVGGEAAEHVVAGVDDHLFGAQARAGHHDCWLARGCCCRPRSCKCVARWRKELPVAPAAPLNPTLSSGIKERREEECPPSAPSLHLIVSRTMSSDKLKL
jgi:hypothetical protein